VTNRQTNGQHRRIKPPSLSQPSGLIISMKVVYVLVCLSSVAFVRPAQKVELFGNIFAPSNS